MSLSRRSFLHRTAGGMLAAATAASGIAPAQNTKSVIVAALDT